MFWFSLRPGVNLSIGLSTITRGQEFFPRLAHLSGVTASKPAYPDTPDGRYFLVRGRLWRRSDPGLTEKARSISVQRLMTARRAIRKAMAQGDTVELQRARAQDHAAKLALGERGPPWWTDGAPDYNRHLARNTPYATWSEQLEEET